MKTDFLHRTHSGAARRLDYGLPAAVLALALVMWSCADPRNEPPTAPDDAYTQTIVLAENAVSNGASVSMPFTIAGQLASISQPGVDRPARLFVWVYIEPDADVFWRWSIVDDSLPAWDDPIIDYQVWLDYYDTKVDNLNRLADSCEAHPVECSPDSLAIIEDLIVVAQDSLAIYQDSLDAATADTTRLGSVRDSLAEVLDSRFNLSIQFDAHEFVAYPNAVFADSAMNLAGQEIHMAAASEETGLIGKAFDIDLAQFDAADENNIGRPIEVNWTTCFAGVDRPCMSQGDHTFSMAVSGGDSWITATLVLVYAEEQ